jgi:hypothetical protein
MLMRLMNLKPLIMFVCFLSEIKRELRKSVHRCVHCYGRLKRETRGSNLHLEAIYAPSILGFTHSTEAKHEHKAFYTKKKCLLFFPLYL